MTMIKDRREGWLRDLKVGDEVAYSVGLRGDYYRINKIASITPAGRIRTDIGGEFDWNGRPGNGRTGSTSRLEPLTDEIRNHVRHRRLVEILSRNLNAESLAGWSLAALVSLNELREKLCQEAFEARRARVTPRAALNAIASEEGAES